MNCEHLRLGFPSKHPSQILSAPPVFRLSTPSAASPIRWVMTSLDLASTLQLNDGRSMPILGLGVWRSTDGDEVNAVRWALEAGYRHVDTAAIYKNEEGVGQAIRESGIPREAIWVTTKVWNDDMRAGNAKGALETSLSKLGLSYVDLYLLHWPTEGRVKAWKQLIEMREQGQCKSIGVSNFMTEHINELIDETGVTPSVNQVELHPYLQQLDVQSQCKTFGIAVEGWSPLMQGKFKDDALLHEIAARNNKSVAQILIRWALQQNIITIPKSKNRSRIVENSQVFDFELSEADMASISTLEKGERFADPRNFSF